MPKTPSKPTTARANLAYANLPLTFERNQGQVDGEVKFLSRGSGYNLFLTPTESVLQLRTQAPSPKSPAPTKSQPQRSATVRMKLVNANAQAEISGLDELPGKSNYFLGNDPRQWRTNVPHYAKVKYAAVYPGIDVVYYGNQRELEYDLIVAPHADPNVIQLSFEGARQIRLNWQGDLELFTVAGKVVHHKPHLYQEINGIKLEIKGKYVLQANNQVAFAVGAYNKSQPLVIDPEIVYSTWLGGGGNDNATSVAVDVNGNAYIAGWTTSVNFPTTAGTVQSSNLTNFTAAYVTKLNASGTALVYSTYLGGTQYSASGCQFKGNPNTYGYALAIDPSGNVYVTGETNSLAFPTTANAYDQGLQSSGCFGNAAVFVTKLTPNGAGLAYSTFLRDSHDTFYNARGRGIAVDANSCIYVTGDTRTLSFPAGANGLTTQTTNGKYNAFLVKVDPSKSGTASLVYGDIIGGTGDNIGNGVVIDPGGNALVVGSTNSTDFPVSAGAFQATGGGATNADAFVIKIDTRVTGAGRLLYSTYLGGSGEDSGNAVAVNEAGQIYITGSAYSNNFPTTPTAFKPTYPFAGEPQRNAGFVAKLDPTKTGTMSRLYASYLSDQTTTATMPTAIGVDGTDQAYILLQGWVARMSADGKTRNYLSSFFAEPIYGYDVPPTPEGLPFWEPSFAHGLAVTPSGSYHVVGAAGPSWGISSNPDPYQRLFAGGAHDGFVLKKDLNAPPTCDPGGGGGGDTSALAAANRTPSTFALEALPPCPPIPQNPVVFIPGIGASRLDIFKGYSTATGIITENIFPDKPLRIGDVLTLDPTKQQQLQGISIIATDANRKQYGELIGSLKKNGYVEYEVKKDPALRKTATCDFAAQQDKKPNLFVFAYDWRKSNELAVDELRDYIGCVQQFHPGKPVNLIAHSMGGLLARRYILKYQTAPEGHKVESLITINTPWLGAPKAIKVLEAGTFFEYQHLFDIEWLGPVWAGLKNLAGKRRTRELYEFFPGGHELLPNRSYYDLGGRPFWEGTEQKFGKDKVLDWNGNEVKGDALTYDETATLLDKFYPTTGFKPGTINQAFFADPKMTDWRNDQTGVKYFQLMGLQKEAKTDGKITSYLSRKCDPNPGNRYCKPYREIKVDLTSGDGTVPILSAERKGQDANSAPVDLAPGGGLIVREILSQQANENKLLYQHVEMLNRNLVMRKKVLEWLGIPISQQQGITNIAPEIIPQAEASATTQVDAVEDHSAYHMQIHGDFDLVLVEDDEGNTDETGSMPYADLEGDFFIFDRDHTHTFKFRVPIEPEADDILNIEINKSVANDDLTATLIIRYRDLKLPRGKEAILKFTPQGVEDLRYDNDGDGIYETVVTPTSKISGQAPLDFLGPAFDIQAVWQASNVSVTLTATDPSGVKDGIWYALDPRQFDPRAKDETPVQFQKYTGTLTINPTQIATVQMMADDTLANRTDRWYQLKPPRLSSANQSFPPAGGNGSVKITFDAFQESVDIKPRWVAGSSVPWITVTAGSTGVASQVDQPSYTDNGTVTFTVAPNNTSSPRTGTLNIGGQIFTVTQEAGGDTTPPTITAPANLTVMTSTSQCTAQVNPGTPTVSDNLPGAIFAGQRSDNKPLTDPYPLGVTTITWTATDAAGNTAAATQTVTVTNPAPLVTLTGPATGTVFAVGTAANFTGSFTDNPGAHTATWSFDGFTAAGTVDEATGTVSGSFTFTTAGVYKVTLTVMDGCGGTGTANTIDGLDLLVVVYDPNGGWVTGGGWINSPAGAYLLDPTLAGKANFGFVSKYHNGATIPTGNTEFQFKAGNLNFSSTVYEWLVIAGARAQYRGSGTINGAGDYRFMLTAIDGQEPGGGGQDKFRIRIWNNAGGGLVYDNQMNAPDNADPTTVLGGGQIVIHK